MTLKDRAERAHLCGAIRPYLADLEIDGRRRLRCPEVTGSSASVWVGRWR